MPRTRTKTRARTGPIDRTLRAPSASRLAAAFLCSACSLPSFAQNRDAAEHFASGRTAFERQDYAGALTAFEAALAAQLDGPAIHYNIGVAAYRLKRFERARAAFEEAARTPAMAALAHYNLGLVTQAQSDHAAARNYFALAYEETQDERLKELARTQLGSFEPPQRFAWAMFASSGLGYDDNVTLSSSGAQLGIAKESDIYGDSLVAGTVQLGGGWRVDGDLSYLNYADLDDYDQLGASVGTRYRFDVADWRTDVGAELGTTLLDGDVLENRQVLLAQATHDLTNAWSMRARYRLSFVDGAGAFGGLDGQRHELSARMTYAQIVWGGNVGYRFERNDYESAALSARRHYVFADAYRSITRLWTARGSLSVRQSEYDGAGGSEARIEMTAGAERSLHDRLTLVMQYSFTDSDADAAALDYRRNRLFVGVEATF
jgi:tetratricopeptide (TPR) repeat protein